MIRSPLHQQRIIELLAGAAQLVAQGEEHLLVTELAGQIVLFERVFLQIKEQAVVARAGVEFDELVASAAQGALKISAIGLLQVLIMVGSEDRAAVGIGQATQQSVQAITLVAGRQGDARAPAGSGIGHKGRAGRRCGKRSGYRGR